MTIHLWTERDLEVKLPNSQRNIFLHKCVVSDKYTKETISDSLFVVALHDIEYNC